MTDDQVIEVLSKIGWTVEKTETGVGVYAGPIDEVNNAGYLRIDTPVGEDDDFQDKIFEAATELSDQMLVTTWHVISQQARPSKPVVEEPESKLILPFPVPTDDPGGVA